MSTAIQTRRKGAITLPMDLRRRYGLSEGHVLSLIDLSAGSFVTTPRRLQTNRLGDKVGSGCASIALHP